MMQIKSIILYNNKGEIRRLDFALNKVNLITGEHDTGKSALIPIVHYCLGFSDIEIPGVINDSVAWYAVLYQIGNDQIFIAKPKPQFSSKEHKAFYKTGTTIKPPEYKDLTPESNNYIVRKEIFNLLRKSLNLPNFDYIEAENLKITIDYTHFYLLQPTENLISKEIFHKHHLRDFKDNIAYLLGAKDDNQLKLKKQLDEKTNDVNKIKRKLEKYDDIIKENKLKIKIFFDEAQVLNLIEKNLITESMDDEQKIEKLKSLLNWTPSVNNIPIELTDFEPELREKLAKLQEEFTEKNIQLKAIESYNDDINGYSKEAKEHQMRLESINLFNQTSIFSNQDFCPLCDSTLSQDFPKISAIKKSLSLLDKNLKVATFDKLNTDKQYEALGIELLNNKKLIEVLKEKLVKIAQEKKEFQSFFKKIEVEQVAIGKLIGRVEEFLNNKNFDENIKDLEETKRILEDELDSIKSQISEDMLLIKSKSFDKEISSFASKINLTYQGDYIFKLDNSELIVKDDNHLYPISIKSMGGLDIPGCHLITLLALHKCFISEKRPVPSFLILDQPIQGYSSESKNVDTDKINKMIQLILDICKDTGLQVILTEHDDLPQTELYRVEKERWTARNALIPESWIK